MTAAATAVQAKGAEASTSMARVIVASSAGTAFEWYDFFIFGSLAPVIGKAFFSGLDPTPALIAALGLFAVGFAFRPLGALIFGIVGDRLGRKGAFLVTVSLMGGATFLIGLLPTYAEAGALAPALLILLRIVQGIALGGEYGGAAIYVAEHSANDRRGIATGWIQSTASFGLLAAMLIIFVSRTWLGEDAFAGWGWRIPFLVSVVLLGVSLWMRLKLSESPEFKRLVAANDVTRAPLREAFGQADNLKRVLVAFFGVMLAQGAVWYFAFFYLQVFLEKTLGVPGSTKDLLLALMTAVSAPLYVFFGWWSDRIGRKPIVVGGMALALLLYFPGSHWIAEAANPALVAAQRSTPVVVETDPATCSAQFDPVGTGKFTSACDIAKSALISRGISYSTRSSADRLTRVVVGRNAVPVAGGEGLSGPQLKTSQNQCRRRDRRGASVGGLSQERRPGADGPARPDRRASAVRRRRDGALRSAGGGARRDVPEPGPLHGPLFPLSFRDRLGRRVPARGQRRHRRGDRQHLFRALVRGRVHRDFGRRVAALAAGNARPQARGGLIQPTGTSGCRSAARIRRAPGRSAPSSSARRRWPAREPRASSGR